MLNYMQRVLNSGEWGHLVYSQLLNLSMLCSQEIEDGDKEKDRDGNGDGDEEEEDVGH